MENEKKRNSEQVDLTEIIVILLRRKVLIAVVTLVAIVIAVVYSLVAEEKFSARTKMVYESASAKSMSESLGALVAIAGINSSSGSDMSAYFSDIIYSRDFLNPILDSVWQVDELDSTNKQNLFSLWKVKSWVDTNEVHWKRLMRYEALDMITKKISFDVIPSSGLMVVETEFSTPYLSYQINNFIIEQLNNVVLKTINQKSVVNREFVEVRMNQAEDDLKSSEVSMKNFRQKNMVVGSPMLMLAQQRLIREMNVRQEVFITLRQQYEMAKIDENKNIPVISTIEKATIPVKRSFPKRKIIVVIGMVLGLFVGCISAFVVEWLSKDDEFSEKIKTALKF